jgi:ATP synthase F1 complex assembly factor 1
MPRENGLEFFYLQFHFHQCILTSLLEYKTRKEKARPYLTLTHFNELSETKDIVLMRGELLDPKILSSANAQFLAFALQTFYCSKNNLKLVKTFNENPEHFDYEELIQEMDKLVPLS